MLSSVVVTSMAGWPRIVASGALWAMVYNLVWGVAWFAFMRSAWVDEFAARGQSSPWTAAVWFLWVVLTLPMGVAIMAHAASDARSPARAAVRAALAVCLLLTLGMGGWGVQASVSIRVLALDAAVNLIGMVSGSVAGAWSFRGV